MIKNIWGRLEVHFCKAEMFKRRCILLVLKFDSQIQYVFFSDAKKNYVESITPWLST